MKTKNNIYQCTRMVRVNGAFIECNGVSSDVYASTPLEAANIFASRYVNRFPKKALEVESFKVKVTIQKDVFQPWLADSFVFNVRPVIKAEFVTTLDREWSSGKVESG